MGRADLENPCRKGVKVGIFQVQTTKFEGVAHGAALCLGIIYHNTPHAGLKGETPANAWKRLSAEQGVTPPPDANTRRVVFGLPHTRKLDRHGLRVFGINYTCPALQEALLRGHAGDVQLRVDPEDLSHVSVCLGHEWVSAQAVPRAVWGLSLEEWQSIVRELRMRFKAEAVVSESIIREARAKIRAVDAHARQLRRLQPMRLAEGALRQAENHLCLGLRIGPEESAATGDLDRRDDQHAASPENLLADVIRPDEPVGAPPAGVARILPSCGNEEWGFHA
ncbi:Mu transposase C-terminal domain-containing protein [Paracoccus jeotgali]|uniref:Mu transposase C-terminal domain-containing protein n=1 Tax=Paracoccus jeotgali TaxID=2065379 RepID=UPI0028AD0123|nr:Mu transposase C-terminal domain-containing protein [Paracoccus jeotgali]